MRAINVHVLVLSTFSYNPISVFEFYLNFFKNRLFLKPAETTKRELSRYFLSYYYPENPHLS